MEDKILSHLLFTEEYTRRVIPFLDDEFFNDNSSKVIFNVISDYIKKYNNIPTKEVINIELENLGLIEPVYEAASQMVATLSAENSDVEWLVETTEKWCQDRALYNAIRRAVKVYDGKDPDLARGSLPQMMADALSVSFESTIGHDYLESWEERYKFYTAKKARIPFDIELLNTITGGGVIPKSLNVAMAGCVHPDTKVRIRYMKEEKTCSISDINHLLSEGYEIEVDSPDGYVPVNFYIEKGMFEEYELQTETGKNVRCNSDHLFETRGGWVPASHLEYSNITFDVYTIDGWESATVNKTGNIVPIVDINVEHENHRYYTEGVSSHNTGVGKSLFLCHLAAAYMTQGKNVLYITLEMAEEEIAQRIDANLMGINIAEIPLMPPDVFDKKIARIKKNTPGKLIIKEYPTASGNANHFRHLMNELKLKKKFNVDVLIIDYINICSSARFKPGMHNSYTIVKAIAEELRGLAIEFKVPLWSATQTNRAGHSSSDVDITEVSESWGLPQTCDLMLALIATEELDEMGQLLIKQLKNRYNSLVANRRFVIGIDRSLMRLFNVEQSAQEGIQDDIPAFDKSGFGQADSDRSDRKGKLKSLIV
jgi:replicative DNA helicase